ncbi:MAG TPA: GNAT family N-acetyltransferase [Ramlibacter sp.]|nr:GNAT family N-acetyltransferase [Ramlibacter sp.]
MTLDALVPMSQEEFAGYAIESVRNFAAGKARAGQWPRGEALKLAKKTFGQLLPEGLATPGHWLFNIVDTEGRKVGVLWMAKQMHGSEEVAYVYDVVIGENHRRQGHAQRAFAAVEAKARELGLAGVALHVFGHNTDAQSLYAKLGFTPTSIHVFKALPAS